MSSRWRRWVVGLWVRWCSLAHHRHLADYMSHRRYVAIPILLLLGAYLRLLFALCAACG
jgi:hypothetical protein